MRVKPTLCAFVSVAALGIGPRYARADAHQMQIEQVIGGVAGDTTAQAIQLRLRFPGDGNVEFAILRAWDAQGANPVTLIDFQTSVANQFQGDRILIASPGFSSYTDPMIVPDFTLSNLIPESYLAAGRITYEDTVCFGGVCPVWWSVSFGGDDYTGPNDGSWNDADGDFGPPYEGPLPTGDSRALLFTGTPTDGSTTNRDDYRRTMLPAVFTNNAGQSTSVGRSGDIDGDGFVTCVDLSLFVDCLELGGPTELTPVGCERADLNRDGATDLRDSQPLILALEESCTP